MATSTATIILENVFVMFLIVIILILIFKKKLRRSFY